MSNDCPIAAFITRLARREFRVLQRLAHRRLTWSEGMSHLSKSGKVILNRGALRPTWL